MYSFSRPRTGEIRSSCCAAGWWCLGATNDGGLLAELLLLLLCCCIKYRLFVQFGSSKGTRQEKTHSKKAHDIDVDRYDDDYDNGGDGDDDNDYGTTGSSAKDDWKRKEGTVSAAAAWAVEVSALMYTTVVLSAGGPLW